MDKDAFRGEALLAVAVAACTYRTDRGWSFARYAEEKVRYALWQEARRQDPASERRRARLRDGQAEVTAADLPPASLDYLLQGRGEEPAGWETDPDPGPEAQVLAREEEVRVREALEALDERERRVLHLRYWKGQTQRAVAAALGLSLTRVHQLEQRAFATLRRRLGSIEGETPCALSDAPGGCAPETGPPPDRRDRKG
jgi:RNA polymerase sigma factor (sigma-70 family)